jgi:hypothetical protein
MSMAPRRRQNRREFLVTGGAAASLAAAETNPSLPRMQLGKHSVSRLICGSNMLGGGSHSSIFLNLRLKQYYKPDQILKTLRRCGEVGITGWQGGAGHIPLYRRLVDSGVKMNFLAIEANADNFPRLAAGGCIGVAHHGEYTDRLFKAGKIAGMNEFLKRLRDSGLLVGVSTHMPAVVDTVESKGWDVDYYMTCVYERHRSASDLKTLLGYVPLPVGEVYLQEDPPRMYRMIRQTKRPCLAFKILAAGRLSDKKELVEAAFRDTFANIKPTDGAIVGIYDEYSDQPLENAALVRKYGALPG